MKIKLGIPSVEKLTGFLKQYKFILILILVGVILLALPEGKGSSKAAVTEGLTGGEEDFSVDALEEELGEILSRIEGAGEVSVMLTVRSGMERVLATDRDTAETAGESELREKIVVISTDSGEEVVLIGQNYPVFQGALVVCQGGGNPEVQLQLTRAVSALTGLSSGRITVCQGS